MVLQATIHPEETQDVAGKRILSYIERIERLEAEKSNLAEDIKEIYTEVKSTGFCAKTVRKLVKARGTEVQKRREEAELLNLYAAAIQLELF